MTNARESELICAGQRSSVALAILAAAVAVSMAFVHVLLAGLGAEGGLGSTRAMMTPLLFLISAVAAAVTAGLAWWRRQFAALSASVGVAVGLAAPLQDPYGARWFVFVTWSYFAVPLLASALAARLGGTRAASKRRAISDRYRVAAVFCILLGAALVVPVAVLLATTVYDWTYEPTGFTVLVPAVCVVALSGAFLALDWPLLGGVATLVSLVVGFVVILSYPSDSAWLGYLLASLCTVVVLVGTVLAAFRSEREGKIGRDS